MRWTLLALLLCVGCIVPKKRYEELSSDYQAHRTTADAALAQRDATLAERDRAIAARDTKIQSLESALSSAETRAKELQARIDDLSHQMETLQNEKASLVRDRSQLKASVAEMQQALADLADRKAATELRIAQYKDLLARFRALIDAGRLRVKIVDGRMVVEMATDILFASGKAELSPDGKNAVREVAAVLASIPDRQFQVEGHTDNVPISNDRFPSNWELAAARAIVVSKALVEGGVAPTRLSSAAFAEFRPVAENTTPEGKAANRRIEIVVVPDLSQLPGFEELQGLAQE